MEKAAIQMAPTLQFTMHITSIIRYCSGLTRLLDIELFYRPYFQYLTKPPSS